MPTFESRFRGGILGHALGDALGVPVEFEAREVLDAHPVTHPQGHGTHNQPPGTWSDDTSMLLCLLEGLADGGDIRRIAELFERWMRRGYWTPHGVVFDCGITTREAIFNLSNVDHPAKAGPCGVHNNGNGSIMRTLPIALMRHRDALDDMITLASDVSAITHGHHRSRAACVVFCLFVKEILDSGDPEFAWETARLASRRIIADRFSGDAQQHLAPILDRDAAEWRRVPRSDISGSGYVLSTLGASVWCLFTTDSWTECTLKAINLGQDTDTTGAVAGGLAGVVYGEDALPAEWVAGLAKLSEIRALTDRALGEALLRQNQSS